MRDPTTGGPEPHVWDDVFHHKISHNYSMLWWELLVNVIKTTWNRVSNTWTMAFFGSLLLSCLHALLKNSFKSWFFLKISSKGAKLCKSRKLKVKKDLFALSNNITITASTDLNSNDIFCEFKILNKSLNWERGFSNSRESSSLVCAGLWQPQFLAPPSIRIHMFIAIVLSPTAGNFDKCDDELRFSEIHL